tara:strand:- start:156 stop:677 length:522 start_codon:yes stop_codon:yes gene_type:complete
MSKTSFKLKSGNTTAFKMMGSSPAKLVGALKNLTLLNVETDEEKQFRKEHWGMNQAELDAYFKQKGENMLMEGKISNIEGETKEEYFKDKNTNKKKITKPVPTKPVPTKSPIQLGGIVKLGKAIYKSGKKLLYSNPSSTTKQIKTTKTDHDKLYERFIQSIKDPVVKTTKKNK